MEVVVTGSTGLAGSAVMRKLSQIGETPVGISSSTVDLRNRESTFEFFMDLKPSLVICCAAKVGGIGANLNFPVQFLSENLQIQTNVLDACHLAKVERLIFLGSSCIYPRDCPQPMEEENLLTGSLEPTNKPYALAKLAGIELVSSYRKQFNKRWISTLPTNLYGPNDNYNPETSHVMAALIRKFVEASDDRSNVTVWGTGSARREFLHSNDLAEALVILAEKYDSPKPVNIGTSVEVSIRELVAIIAECVNFEGQINWDSLKPDGAPRKILSNTIMNGLGWKPKINLRDGIMASISDFRELQELSPKI